MSIQVCGDNRKENIASDTFFVDGDIILSEPGEGLCASRVLRCSEDVLKIPGFFQEAFELDNSPSYGGNQRGLKILPGAYYSIVDKEEFGLGDSFILEHPKDPLGKRYVEAWVTYYPSAAFSLFLHSKDENVLGTSESVSIKPLIYPELTQTISSSPGLGPFLTQTQYHGIQLWGSGEKVVVYNSSAAIIYEWNGSGYSEGLVHSLGLVYSASVDGDSAIVLYQDSGDWKLALYEKDGTWNLDRVEDWALGQREVMLTSDYIISGGSQTPGVVFNKSDLSVSFEAVNPDYLEVVPADDRRYHSTNGRVYGCETAYVSVLGSPLRQTCMYTEMKISTSWVLEFGGWTGDGYKPYTSNEDGHVGFTGSLMMRHPLGSAADEGFILKTNQGELYPYNYLYKSYNAELDLSLPSISEGYIVDEFLVNFSSQVYYAAGSFEAVVLYEYSFSSHKKYSGCFFPVKYPYFLVNGSPDTLHLLEAVKTHYDEVPPATATLSCETPSAITTTDDFEIPEPPVNTMLTLLLSSDNSTFYKWNGVDAWVTESDISLGNSRADFISGCQAGFIFPADSYSAYVKIQMSSTARDETPEIGLSETSLHLTTISVANNSYLCDDSKVLIEHLSETETKITSLINQNVIMSAQLCIIAPPYNVDYET